MGRIKIKQVESTGDYDIKISLDAEDIEHIDRDLLELLFGKLTPRKESEE